MADRPAGPAEPAGAEADRAPAPVAPPIAPVTVWGIARGAEFAGPGALSLADDGIVVRLDGGGDRIVAWERVDGLRGGAGQLALYLNGGDVIEIGGSPRLAAAGREIAARICALPEQTLTLRALGSRRGRPGAEHDRFFAPLLTARKKAGRAADAAAQLAAFDAPALSASFTGLVRQLAAALHPASPPDRRAVEAELFEHAAPLFGRLDALHAAAEVVRAAPDDARFVRWREWAVAVRAVFAEADRSWLAVIPALGDEGAAREEEGEGAAPPSAAPPRSAWRRLLRLGGIAIVAAAAGASPLHAQHGVLRVTGARADSLLAWGFDVVEIRKGDVLVVADSAEERALRDRGYGVADMPTPATRRRRAPALLTPTVVYRDWDDPARGIEFFLDSLAAANPNVHLDTLGLSYEGRRIVAAKIGPAGDSPTRPNVLFMATYHAREWAATEMALRLIRYLAQNPAPDARVDSLVKGRDIWIVPVANPDGYEFTFTTDRLWRKNRRPITLPAVGVDLNRNHAADWGFDNSGSSPDANSDIYRGPSPASEPETQAIQAFHANHPPVVSVSYHTYTGLLLYPPGYDYGLLPGDLGVYRALAGTDERPAVVDRLPNPERDHYHPAASWNLYTTNGEYNDWASQNYGAISFTPELTSGYEAGIYYGFEFPDDESRLATVFQDNLPFALSALEAAGDPAGYRSPVTGFRNESLVLESIGPRIRARVPAIAAAGTEIRAPGTLLSAIDPVGGGRYSRRVVSEPVTRPGLVTLFSGGATAVFSVLTANGAEPADTGWVASGAVSDTGGMVGQRQWRLPDGGVLRSSIVHVPDQSDTVSLLYWTRYDGNGFSLAPHGVIRVSRDSGLTWQPEASVAGFAPAWYTEGAEITGVAGKWVGVEFQPTGGLVWWLDEVALVAHTGTSAPPVPVLAALAPSENPVRSGLVWFTWPFPSSGDLTVFDFAGREVWRVPVLAGSTDVAWNVVASRVANGAYLVVARSQGRTERRRLFIARR